MAGDGRRATETTRDRRRTPSETAGDDQTLVVSGGLRWSRTGDHRSPLETAGVHRRPSETTRHRWRSPETTGDHRRPSETTRHRWRPLHNAAASWTPLQRHPGYWGLDLAAFHPEDEKASGGWLSSASPRLS